MDLKTLTSQRINNPLYNWENELNRQFSKEEIQMINKHKKKCLTSLGIKEMQIKITLRFHLTLDRMAIINNTKTNAGEDVGGKDTVGGNVN
jgi:hypothetical protein